MSKKYSKYLSLIFINILFLSFIEIRADNIDEALIKIEDGDFISAKNLLEAANPKTNAIANLYLGRIAFLNYDFDEAENYYGQYKKLIDKKRVDPDEDYYDFENELEIATNSLRNVEKIVIIDSIAVPKSDFFKNIRLPESAGFILNNDELSQLGVSNGSSGFLNEGLDFLLWSAEIPEGENHIYMSEKLLDGNWEEPVFLDEKLNIGPNQFYPFMAGDGTTVYFASDGEDSMGGLDIFIAKMTAGSREFFQPANLGMPYNSPFDDYMLAIDEENGIGWFATDRNLLGDKLTLYVYLLNDMRSNYNSDMEDITSFAKIDDYKLTWNGDEKYSHLASSKIPSIASSPANSINPVTDREFELPFDNRIYYKFTEFKKRGTEKAMRAYLQEKEILDSKEKKLDILRRKFAESKSENVKKEIVTLENEVEKLRLSVSQKLNEVYRAERK